MSRFAEIFRPEPLPRLRAMTSITFGGAALLAGGGMLEYASGSPSALGTSVTGYWALFFAVYFVALGGAALLGAFPRLGSPAVKILWALAVGAVYACAFAVWWQHQPVPDLSAWIARSAAYVPAAVALAVGLLWSTEVAAVEDGQ